MKWNSASPASMNSNPMGFIYRKSVNLGPFRVNLSKSGVGYSVGWTGLSGRHNGAK
jgi:hypothetical protein